MMSHRSMVGGGNLCVAVKKSRRKFWRFAENYYLCSELRRGTAATEHDDHDNSRRNRGSNLLSVLREGNDKLRV